MTRRTIVVPGRLAWHEERFRAAEENALGLQILTPAQLAGRLAGGFLEAASRDTCHLLVRDALANFTRPFFATLLTGMFGKGGDRCQSDIKLRPHMHLSLLSSF